MANVIGVRFRSGSKVYFFDPKELELKQEEQVIVETARGVECGRVVMAAREVDDRRVSQPLRAVVRRATEEDLAKEAAHREREKEAYKTCRQRIAEHGLNMKLIRAEYSFDGKKLLFYFTADGRIDFRDLVKDLAAVFHTRIELRQVGVRDEAKMLGGIGSCGRPLCCSTFLSDFAPVSIKMAKEQNLSLNPTKISGTCGRLMCCLKNEQETYEYLLRRMPGVGDIVQATDGSQGKVHNVNVLRQTCRVVIEVDEDNKELREFPVDELEIISKKQKGRNNQKPREKKNREAAEAGEGGRGAGHAKDKYEGAEGRSAAERNGEGADGAEDGEGTGEKRRRRRNRGRRRGRRDGEGAAEHAGHAEAPSGAAQSSGSAE